jgi:hypothetical protein
MGITFPGEEPTLIRTWVPLFSTGHGVVKGQGRRFDVVHI